MSVSEMLSDPILEGLCKSKLQNSAQLQTVMALYDEEVVRNNGTPNYQQLKTAVKLHIDQMMRNRNFKARNDVVEKGSVTKSQKGNKDYVERKVGECFQCPQVLSSPTGPSSRPSASTTSMGRSCTENPVHPLAGVGRLAEWPTQLRPQHVRHSRGPEVRGSGVGLHVGKSPEGQEGVGQEPSKRWEGLGQGWVPRQGRAVVSKTTNRSD